MLQQRRRIERVEEITPYPIGFDHPRIERILDARTYGQCLEVRPRTVELTSAITVAAARATKGLAEQR
ncbi:hypothetical protein GCM10020255_074980 [Rhodococcus baikonurensis]